MTTTMMMTVDAHAHVVAHVDGPVDGLGLDVGALCLHGRTLSS